MAFSRENQDELLDATVARLIADNERWLREQLAEATPEKDSYCESRGITGAPSNANRVYRASESRWNVAVSRPRMYEAIAASEAFDPLSYATVKVTRNGVTETVAAGDFRRGKSRKASQAPQARTPEAVRFGLAPIGDSNH